MKTLCLLFSLLFSEFLFAQTNERIDSLYHEYNTSEIDSVKINCLLQLTWETKNNSIDTAFYFIALASDIAEKINDSLYIAKTSYYKAVLFYFTGESKKFNLQCEKAILYYGDFNIYGQASIYNLKGLMHTNKGELNEALASYLQSLKLGRQTNDLHAIANPYHNIGMIYEELEEYDKALKNYQDALKIREEINDSTFIIQSMVSIGGVYFLKYDYKNAENYLTKAINLLVINMDTWTLSKAISDLGLVYQETKRYQLALLKFNECIQLQSRLQDNFGLVISYLNIAETYMSLKKYDKAIEYALKGEKLAKRITSKKELSKLYSLLSRAYFLLGNYKTAFEMQQNYLDIKDSLINEVKTKEISALQIEFETEKKEKELLETKKEKAEAELKVSKKSKQIWLLIGGTSILLLVSGFLFYRIKQKQKNKLTQIRIEEQQKGLAAIIQGQEDERKRIAKDLHDGIVQQLGGLKLGLQKVFTGKETEETSKIIQILDGSTQELRELSHKMMPRSLSELGLIPALEDMLDNSLGNSSIQHQFEHFGITTRFKGNIEIAIYRIAQELVNNVIKHSNATKVNVQLFKTGNDILLIVEDNGKGISNIKKEGIGLMNIISRLDTINGKVNFEPSPESGTLATVKIPV
ncbi:MAG: sensor histidine kinase [Flavobacteriales bacterium]|nr:sensor histidine kinase [Flavobacteriales bacterium]